MIYFARASMLACASSGRELSQPAPSASKWMAWRRANQALKVLEDAGLVRSEYDGINILDLDGRRSFGD